jgi:uncharacterized protein
VTGTPSTERARYPGRAPIDAYGNGGFRFAGMSHRGSILCTAGAIIALEGTTSEEIAVDALALLKQDSDRPLALLLGTGATHVFMPAALRERFAAADIALEPMTTGAAARTYNIMLAEQRPVAAALLAVE